MQKVLRLVTLLILFNLFSCSGNSSSNSLEEENSRPTAVFSVTPVNAIMTTPLFFDASTSYDTEDSLSVLEVRWDWENDNIWDTDYSLEKIEIHQYDFEGQRVVCLEVKDSGGLVDKTTKVVRVGPFNTPPIAVFSVSPSSGSTSTTFEFDASGSYDNEDTQGFLLLVRWDFENDGIWDIPYTPTKTVQHQYSSGGLKTVLMEVIDSRQMSDTVSKQIMVN